MVRNGWLEQLISAINEKVAHCTSGLERLRATEEALSEVNPESIAEELILKGLLWKALRSEDVHFPATLWLTPHHEVNLSISKAAAIKHIVDTSYSSYITAATLGRRLGLGPRCVATTFKAAYGLSVQKYLIRVRVTAAAELLMTTDIKTECLHSAVGYRSRGALYKEFGRLMRTTPARFRSEWRRRSQKVDKEIREEDK